MKSAYKNVVSPISIESLRHDDAIGSLLTIYQIRNTISNRKYIGVTTQYERRIKTHFQLLRRSGHWIDDMQNDFNIYLESNFVSEILYQIDYVDSDQKKMIERIALTCAKNLYNTNDYKHKFLKKRVPIERLFPFCIDEKRFVCDKVILMDLINGLKALNQIIITPENDLHIKYIALAFIARFKFSKWVNYKRQYRVKTKTLYKNTANPKLSICIIPCG